MRPLYTHSSPTFNPQTSHAGLWYDKFCDQWTWNRHALEVQKVGWIQTVASERHLGNAEFLSQFAGRQQRMIEVLGGKCLPFHTESRFVTGLGREHPVENGFAWHPTLGTPYLPGSSIKGMVRAWAVMNEQQADADKILGRQESPNDEGQAGLVIFFDAIPLGPVKLEVDVMTPHYTPYYESGEIPGDWMSPVPVPFLVVSADTNFQFSIAPRNTNGKAHLESVVEWLKNSLQWLGAGAKTAVGYGRFQPGKSKIAPPLSAVVNRPRHKERDIVTVTRVEDPKPKAGKPRIWFVADDGFGGVVTGGTPPEIDIGASTQLEVAAVLQHGGYNFRVPKGK